MDQETMEEFKVVNARLGVLETDVAVIRSNYVRREDLVNFRADVATRFGQVDTAIAGLRADILKLQVTMITWVVATGIAFCGVAVGVARYWR